MSGPPPGGGPAGGPLYGPAEVAAMLGVKPQVVINWIREGRAHPSADDALGRHRFTAADIAALRASLGTRRRRATMGEKRAGPPGDPGPDAPTEER